MYVHILYKLPYHYLSLNLPWNHINKAPLTASEQIKTCSSIPDTLLHWYADICCVLKTVLDNFYIKTLKTFSKRVELPPCFGQHRRNTEVQRTSGIQRASAVRPCSAHRTGDTGSTCEWIAAFLRSRLVSTLWKRSPSHVKARTVYIRHMRICDENQIGLKPLYFHKNICP